MTSLPPISTALPSIGGPGGPAAGAKRTGGAPQPAHSPLAHSSMRSSFSSSTQLQQSPNLASPGGRSSRNSVQHSSSNSGSVGATRGSDAVASITDDIIMHHVVPIIKARNMEGFLLWLKDAPTVNIQDFAGNTPLHWACHKGLPEFVAVLLRHEALKDAANRNGATPLHCAAISGVRAVVEILLQAGADPMTRNSHGRSFFDVLRSKGHSQLLELFEPLELKLLAREAPAQSTIGDTWLDASRIGAESDSDGDHNEKGTDTTPSRLPPINTNHNSGNRRHSTATVAVVADGPPPASGHQYPHHQLEEPQQRRGSHYRVVTIAGSGGTNAIAHGNGAMASDLERRVRALEEFGNSVNPSSSARLLGASGVANLSPPLLELETSQTSILHGASVPLGHQGIPNVYYTDQRHTIPPPVGGVSPANVKMALSGSATPRHPPSSSPQRYIGPSGRILCSTCEEGSRAIASGYCEECRRAGDECWFCDKCWKSEHASKRTRQHRKGPVPVPAGHSSVTPRTSLLHQSGDAMELFPFDTASLNPEARAYLMLQQQLIAAFSRANGGSASNHSAEAAEMDDAATQTVERIQSTYFDEAMVELQDVREQLEAEVYHSQVLIDSTRTQLLEALELRHRAEIETMCWRKYLTVKRPPQVVVLYDPSFIPPALEGLLQQRSGAPTTIAKLAASTSVRTSSPPSVHITSPPVRKRNATNSQGTQCVIPPPAANATTNTEHSGGDPAPAKALDGGSFKPRYTEDAVELVHGEKHLPDQPQMLLVRWHHGGLESWVPAYEVAHCSAVIAYLSRYDKTLVQNEGDDEDDGAAEGLYNRHSSPLGESERTEFSNELAALKRTGTATGSRESADQFSQQAVGAPRIPPRQRPRVSSNPELAPNELRPPLAPPVVHAQREPSKGDEDVSMSSAQLDAIDTERRDTPTDDELVRKYEQRLKDLESKQQRLQKLREDQVTRLQDLKNKQILVDEQARAGVRRQYEAKQMQLQEQQPEQAHPLVATNDKHAALVLQELQQEVQEAERTKRNSHHTSPHSSAPRQDRVRAGQPAAESEGANSRSASRRNGPDDLKERKQSIPPPPPPAVTAGPQGVITDGPSFEQKINRILYEQYFYNKAQTSSPKSPRPASLN